MQQLHALRHSCAHILASAVKRLYPGTKFGIGPWIEDGFYYDFDIPQGIKEEDLPRIEEEMRKIIEADYPFIHEMWTKQQAYDFFNKEGQNYKLQLLEEIEEDKVSIYRHDDFVDLCKGPHIQSTSQVKFFKLLNISGAYWRGKESNPMLVRIYGTAFFTKEELEKFLKYQEEARKRDHRILGKKLRLFDIYYDEAGAGLIFWLPKGAILKRIIEDWILKEHRERGYFVLNTPHLLKSHLWKISGHMEYYKDLMFIVKQQAQDFVVKPMNCPAHILVYKSAKHSYKEFPLKFFELGTVYRYEKAGVLHGLLRARGFTQDDAHIFLTLEQLEDEIIELIRFTEYILKKFGFQEYEVEISTQPQEFIGNPQDWEMATSSLKKALERINIPYTINPGEGAFYGPKIDLKLKDSLKRKWQLSTIQVDFALPQRFKLTFVDKDNKEKTPVMIHRALLGSLERFIGILIEHYAGLFPVWLAPVQVKLLSLNSQVIDFVKEVESLFKKEGIRVEVDLRNETLSRKIRDAEEEKIPYICIIGQKEKVKKILNIRKKRTGVKQEMRPEDLILEIKKEVM